MPFIVTEPQKIEGTQLGFAVYPYQFSFDDHILFENKHDRKVVIFKMKDSTFNEPEKILREETFLFAEAKRGHVDAILKKFVCQNAKYVDDVKKMGEYFLRQNNFNLVSKVPSQENTKQ